MDKYRKSAEEIMRRGDAIIAERKRHSAIYKRTAFAVSGLCAAIIAGVGIWNNPQLKNLTDRTPPTGQYIADTTETTVYSENKADTTTTAEEKAVVTAAATDVKVTSRPTAVVTDKQTEKPIETKTSPVSVEIGAVHTETPTTAVTAINTTVVTAEIRPQTTIPYITTAFSECVTTVKPVNTTSSTEIHTTPGLQVVTKPVITTLPPPSGGALVSPTTPDLPVVTKPVTTTLPPPSGGDIESPSSKPMTESPSATTKDNPTSRPTSPAPPTTAIIAPVDIETIPDNPDEVTGIIYDTVLYKKTNDTAILDNIQYEEQKFLGIVCSDNKQYGELFVISDFIDDSYDVLLFKPAGSNEYICFTP